MAFFWNYTLKLDDKGRITIPSEYKHTLEKDFRTSVLAVVHGVVQQKCLVVYPQDIWVQKMKKLIQSSSGTQDARKILNLRRYLTSNTYQKELDKNGKLLIPPRLWHKLDIDNIRNGIEMVIIGNFDCFEVWLKSTWDNYQQSEMSSYQQGVDPEEFTELNPEELFYLGNDDDDEA